MDDLWKELLAFAGICPCIWFVPSLAVGFVLARLS